MLPVFGKNCITSIGKRVKNSKFQDKIISQTQVVSDYFSACIKAAEVLPILGAGNTCVEAYVTNPTRLRHRAAILCGFIQ